MGNYTSAEDVRRLYKPIDTTNLNDNDIDYFILKAEAEIDGKIALKYTVPISPAPSLLRIAAGELALVYILERFFTSETGSSNEWAAERKKDIKELIDMIASGEVLLVDANGNTIAQTGGTIQSNTSIYNPIFTLRNPIEDEVDPDLLDDEDSARD